MFIYLFIFVTHMTQAHSCTCACNNCALYDVVNPSLVIWLVIWNWHINNASRKYNILFNFWIQDDGILAIPTTACLPPKLGAKEMLSEDYQIHSFSLLSIASLSGCCQVQCSLSCSKSDLHAQKNTIFLILGYYFEAICRSDFFSYW